MQYGLVDLLADLVRHCNPDITLTPTLTPNTNPTHISNPNPNRHQDSDLKLALRPQSD